MAEAASSSRPAHVPEQQWKKFLELRARREREVGRGTERRVQADRNRAIKTVNRELSVFDKAVLREEGADIPPAKRARHSRHASRQRKKHSNSHETDTLERQPEVHLETEQDSDGHSEASATAGNDSQWAELKKYLDPNAHLTAQELGRYAPKSRLEEEMESAIEQGQLETAADMSDTLATQEFASRIATAFDCQDYAAKKKVEEDRKRDKRKLKKSKSGFEVKQRWETKGNM